MYVPLSWLNEYAPTGVDPTDRDAVRSLGRALDSLGLVIESTRFVGEGLGDVVLAQVRSIEAIEGADKIRKVEVDRGGGELVGIVCGATNFAEGDVVPLAPIGATLPGGFTIQRRKLRGVVSEGMLCSGSELGLSDDHAGLMILVSGAVDGPLPDGVVLGEALTAHLGIEPDVVFDVGVEPNRPDALSIVGVARDLAAKLGLPFVPPKPSIDEQGPEASTLASVSTSVPMWCDRILGRVLTGCTVVASPPLVRRRLALAGMRPINAIVDASNYVMLELGQPTHPYDLAKLGGSGIGVRLAAVGEELVTLDGERRTLGIARDRSGEPVEIAELVITDARDRVVGLAGVMGGSESEIAEDTTDVLLEVAHFDPLIVGRQAARHGLRTEASQRFWRGTDIDGMACAADRFCELVVAASYAAGVEPPAIAPGALDDDLRAPAAPPIRLRTGRVNAVLGTAIGRDAIVALLEPIGFEVVVVGDDLDVMPPGFRHDVGREVDVIEEVARHYGYDRITGPPRRSVAPGQLSDRQRRRRAMLRILQGAGADEAWTNSIVDPLLEERIGPDGPLISILNPIVQPETTLRTRLLPGLLGALRRNESHRNGAIRLFEVGRVFSASGDGDERPAEKEVLGLLLANDGDDATTAVDLFHALVDGLGIDPEALALEAAGERDDPADGGTHPTRTAFIVDGRDGSLDRRVLGVVGEVDPELLRAAELSGRRVGWLAIDLDRLFAAPLRSRLARPISEFPSSDIDLAFILDDDVPADRLRDTVGHAAGALLESIRLLDVYRGPSVPDGTRSLTLRLRLSALDHTLGTEEIQTARDACIAAVEGTLPARLRS
ncbi:MAG TPA: phenylalanine--tRNA ligase subunit beta [Acidimicrobiales bacterium]|jgi:phenylalanyl-tRNA synthetase beta chain|nr:phenylalanine--tRNA ligase subunit beta [Acidimicrobiales bacterium]